MQIYDYEKEHMDYVRDTQAECTLFLKRNGDFPLKEAGKIAAYGNGIRYTVKGGTGSGEVNSRYSINIEEGLKKKGFTITTNDWLLGYDYVRERAREYFVDDIKKSAKKKRVLPFLEAMGAIMPEPEYEIALNGEGEVAIYVLSRISGEGADRQVGPGEYLLNQTEIDTILALNRKYKKFMLVINAGGPVDLSPVLEVENILVLSQLGAETGLALAEILLGERKPSGKLATSWAYGDGLEESMEFGLENDTRYREGIYVGYRYYDSVGIEPLFPFGYGLSYTQFDIFEEKAALVKESDEILVTAMITNTGMYAGKEVLQVYVSSPEKELDQPYQSLVGFAKTKELKPMETEFLQVRFRLSDLASYSERLGSYLLEAGDYVIRVGNSSRNTNAIAVVRLTEDVITKKVKNCLGETDFTDYKPKKRVVTEIPEDLPVLEADQKSLHIKTMNVTYHEKKVYSKKLAELPNDVLAKINVGGYKEGINLLNIIGNAGSSVAGTAGETTDIFSKRGLPPIVMADGPAGIRLSKDYYIDKKGEHGYGAGMLPESMADFMPAPMRALSKVGKVFEPKREVLHRYATALPIGTAIAQSFNTELAESYGEIVGDEMERFGIDLWLAPALNIHRSVLCGRNFEYYSEDPIVSGKMAAAVTRGVQKHKNRGVTIKHYAANNQETNRYNNNSIVSERAMREIYLKGFEICIREGKPEALMTSYNLLNGIHTAEHPGLINDILRCEFAYEGVVMTDWMIDGFMGSVDSHPQAKADTIAACGVDLIMPGSKKNVSDILFGLKIGTVTRDQLLVNATRVLKKAREKVASAKSEGKKE